MTKDTIFTVQGTKVNAAIINGFSRRVGSLDEVISVWANAGAIQAVQHGNLNWLTSLLSTPIMRLKTGDLSKQGKEVLSYITAHCPRIQWSKDAKKLGLKKINAEHPLANHFLAHGATEATGNIVDIDGKLYTPVGDFHLTFQGYKNFVAEKTTEDKPAPALTAKVILGQMEKALVADKDNRLVGSLEELTAAAAKVHEVYAALNAAIAASTQAAAAKAQRQADIDKLSASVAAMTTTDRLKPEPVDLTGAADDIDAQLAAALKEAV